MNTPIECVENWEVVSAKWIEADKLWKAEVKKSITTKVVYFPREIKAGDIVKLDSV